MHSKTQATLASSCPMKEPSAEKVSLSLDLLIGGGSGDSVKPPPGLDTASPKPTSNKIKPPPGLEALLGSDVETGTGSSEGDSASMHSCESEASPLGLVLSDVSTLTSKAKSFTPMLSPEEVNMLMPDTTKKSTNRFADNRTKLRSKANAYVPAASFIPMAATAMAMADTLKRSTDAAAAQSYAAGFADAAAAAAQIIEASLQTTTPTTSTYESEQYAAWDDSWEGYEGYEAGYDESWSGGDYQGWPQQAW